MKPIIDNPESYLAMQFALNTGESIFVTGRAGTGKTTFLRLVKETSKKKMAIAAPTGIAAINAGGVTLHSLFQLPFGTYTPDNRVNSEASSFYTKDTLLRNLRMADNKRRLLNELELLIIDEVSMLRSDVLDAIDIVLKHIRHNKKQAFGGVQVLFIGDLQQLPPVINQQEWQHLSAHYTSPYFFSSHAFRALNPQYIEFKKIYRQTEATFINLLENVRNNKLTTDDIQLLNSRYIPSVSTQTGTILLTTHNQKADLINKKELEHLPGDKYTYKGNLEGDFNEKNLPTEMQLTLKAGAQVMFVKNDSQAEKRYFNGKMGRIKSLTEESIIVEFPEENTNISIQKESWKTIRYVHNPASDRVEEEEMGSFSQYPIKLAWAITIHKSQGLTFDKVLIDAADAFASGQVYVALSRCRSLEGITLTSTINNNAIQSDERLKDLSPQEKQEQQLLEELQSAKLQYARKQLTKAFLFTKELELLTDFHSYTDEKRFADKQLALTTLTQLIEKVKTTVETGDKFVKQLETFFDQHKTDSDWLQERVGKAMLFFSKQWHDEIIKTLENLSIQLKPKKGVKQFMQKLGELEERYWTKLNQIQGLQYGNFDFSVYQTSIERQKPVAVKKAIKGDTYLESFQLFKEGKTISEIAEIRGMVSATIEGHLSRYVAGGEIEIQAILPSKKIEIISVAIKKSSGGSKEVKETLGEDYSYGEIKLVLAHLQRGETI